MTAKSKKVEGKPASYPALVDSMRRGISFRDSLLDNADRTIARLAEEHTSLRSQLKYVALVLFLLLVSSLIVIRSTHNEST